MKSVNEVTLLGRVGGDPEIRYTQSNQPVANLSIATSYSTKNEQTGQYDEHTDWHRVTAFGKRAEIIQKYVHKGDQIFVRGRLKPGKYTDKDGKEVYKIDIMVDDIVLLGSKRDGDSTSNYTPSTAASKPKAVSNEFDEFIGSADDSLPF